MIQKIFKNPLLYVFLLALLLRIYKLGEIPVGLHVDEVKAGWNAYSILNTGKDDWGKSWQLHYNSFGDFRPTGYFYLTIPSIIIFGLNEFAIRFPSAFLGALTVVPIFFLVKKLTRNTLTSTTSSFFLAISPWHISLSRATSEGIVSVFLGLSGLYFLISSLKNNSTRDLIFSFIALSLSFFFYHSARLLLPLFSLTTIIYSFRNYKIRLSKKRVISFVALLFSLTLIFSLQKEGRGRFSQVSIFNDLDIKTARDQYPFEEGPNKVLIARTFHNKSVLYANRFIKEYLRYFSADFLIGDSAKPIRYKTVDVGPLMYVEFLLVIIGIATIIRRTNPSLPVILLLIAPLPAALTTEDSPNLHRAIFMIPFFSIIAAYGVSKMIMSEVFPNKKDWSIFFKDSRLQRQTSSLGSFIPSPFGLGNSETSLKKRVMFYLTICVISLNFIYFEHMYLVHNSVHEPIPANRNVGIKEVIDKIENYKEKFDVIYLTNIPDDIYPWFAFYTSQEPASFNGFAKERDKGAWSYQNIIFGQIKCPSKDVDPKNFPGKKLLLIDAEGCDSKVLGGVVRKIDEVKRYQGGISYTFWTN